MANNPNYNRCGTYFISCPWAFIPVSNIPCKCPPETCEQLRKTYEQQQPDDYRKATELLHKVVAIRSKPEPTPLEKKILGGDNPLGLLLIIDNK
jgi:hypothetical protein